MAIPLRSVAGRDRSSRDPVRPDRPLPGFRSDRRCREVSTQAERLNGIVQRVAERGAVSVSSLAEELGVSEATIRRDLDLLDEQRLLTRTHGGATPRNGVTYELPLRYRAEQHRAEKARIAEAAAELVAAD